MRNYLKFIRELLRNRITRLVLAVYGFWGFSTTVVDQFFPSSSDKLKTIHFLPKWHWHTWLIVGLGLVIVLLFDGAYKIWAEKEKSAATIMSGSPQVIIDFDADRFLIVRNIGPSTAVNVRIDPFVVGDTTVICDLVNRLLPNTDTARLTAEIRRDRDVRKPCLLALDGLFKSVLGRATVDADTRTALMVMYEDLGGRKYRVEYLISYRSGINKCQTEFKTLDLIR